jgi:hypothetical protein
MINKDFTLYPEALELKQLGFDEPCFMLYNSNAHWTEYGCTNTNIDLLNGKASLVCTAPTYAQAFRWFREKHNLIGGVEYIGGMKPTTTWWDIYVVGHYNIDHKEMSMKYQPYEKAELACLRKLIEIVKQKQI